MKRILTFLFVLFILSTVHAQPISRGGSSSPIIRGGISPWTGDLDLWDDTPHILWRDIDDNTAYMFHLETGVGGAPYNNFQLWRGVDTGLNFLVKYAGVEAGELILTGVMAGLMSCGLYSGTKAIVEK